MIVFGVCALGVGGLYLVPSMASPPPPVSVRQVAEEPQPRPSASPAVKAPQAGATGEAAQPDVTDAATPGVSQATAVQPQPTEQPSRSSPSPAVTGRTAYDPQDSPDNEPPSAVGTISATEVTPDELGLTWPAATDNRRVIGYRIILNGYEVATTVETQVKLHWFNDEDGQHVVQIKAIDAAGNQSTSWATLLVTRPSPGPTVSSTPAQTTPPADPTSPPSPTQAPSVTPSAEPTVHATGSPTQSIADPSPR